MPRFMTWRIGLGALLVTTIVSLAILINMNPPAVPGPAYRTIVTQPVISQHRLDLQKCQVLAQPDDYCRQVWADNRRHFLGLDEVKIEETQS
jgi:conjugative transfer region protein TrbK